MENLYTTSINGKRALVLGGGGQVGRAWQSGLMAKLLAEGINLQSADKIIGTSADSISGAQLALGIDLKKNFSILKEVSAGVHSPDALGYLNILMAKAAQSSDPQHERQEMGHLALETENVSEDESLKRIQFLKDQKWPANYYATAANALTGQFHLWDKDSGIPLLLGVGSSSALPTAWPPITINGVPYVDGGVRSMLNADLAVGHESVIVISCFALTLPDGYHNEELEVTNACLQAEIDSLREQGANVTVITPNEEFLKLTNYGANMRNLNLVSEAWQVGNRQAIQEIGRIDKLWQ